MSEAATEQQTTSETSTDQQTSATENAESNAYPADLGETGKQAIDRMKAERDSARREARVNADAAQRLADLEESQKTEAQKVADRAAAAERARDEAVADGLRYKAAARHGVDEDHFDLLGTGDEETITGRAERIGGLLKLQSENERLTAEVEALKQGKPAPSSARPTESLKPGATAEQIRPPQDNSYPSHWLPERQQRT